MPALLQDPQSAEIGNLFAHVNLTLGRAHHMQFAVIGFIHQMQRACDFPVFYQTACLAAQAFQFSNIDCSLSQNRLI